MAAMDIIKHFLSAIAGSKKAVATVAAIILVLLQPQLARINIDVTQAELEQILLALLVYVGAQGVADLGKEKAKVEAVAAAPLVGVVSGETGPK
jgi:hypothetical protein